MAGYTLTLDFPMQNGVPTLLAALDEITHRHGGRVYLAKDACCTSERVRQGYPRCATFDTVQAETTGPVPKIAPRALMETRPVRGTGFVAGSINL